jgi:seryl-tRNA synthetase
MLDRKKILENPKFIKERLALKGYDFNVEVFLDLEEKRKNLQTKIEELRAARNANANEIKNAFKQKIEKEKIDLLKTNGKELNETITEEQKGLVLIQEKLEEIYLEMPNIPDEDCPIGENEEDNKLVRTHLEPKVFDFEVKDHIDLAEINENGLDFEKGVKLARSRFTVMKGGIAKLHRALAQFMLDLHTEEHGYLEVNVPVITNKQTLTGTGQLPKFKEDLFKIENEELALIPTAEVPLTNLVANELLNEKELPIKLTAHSLCFRSEAGSAGRDVRGILRQHQFEKVELVQIVKPEESTAALQEILANACKVLDLLELPYRVVELCNGDLGFGARKTFDIEVWVPSQNTYREISSCSNMGDFQARRMKTRYKDENGKKHLVHTLNGSGLAVGRTLLAILENNQNKEGKIRIPTILKPYLNNKDYI